MDELNAVFRGPVRMGLLLSFSDYCICNEVSRHTKCLIPFSE